MFGLDMLAIAGAGLLTLSSNTITCQPEDPPKITVRATTREVRHNFRLTKAQLERKDIDTISPYDVNIDTHIGGLMSGEIEISSDVKLAWKSYPALRQDCLWFDAVNVTFEINPLIYIAREYPKGTCEHDVILEHEYKHVAVDREIVKKYRDVMEEYLTKVLAQVPVYGPVKTTQTPRARQKLSHYIESAIKKVSDSMYVQRRDQQQAIDSLEEYERVANACKK